MKNQPYRKTLLAGYLGFITQLIVDFMRVFDIPANMVVLAVGYR